MKLISLQFLARGTNGWESPVLIFGDDVTSLFALNGSGKSPLIQGLAFCLGFPITFRQDIAGKCESIDLKIQSNGVTLTLNREISKQILVTVKTENAKEIKFVNELDYSNFLFEKFDLNAASLVGLNKLPTQPYMASILPIFYLVQDHGYSDLYRPKQSFIQDQFCEMVRFIFSLTPKNSYDQKKELLRLKQLLDSKDLRIVALQKLISDTQDQVLQKDKIPSMFVSEIDSRKLKLQELKSSNNYQGYVRSAIDDLILQKEEDSKNLTKEILELRTRINGIERIKSEIETEIDTMGLNEESKRIFDSFSDICRNTDCGLFAGSSVSYAKNLLYLRDQIKDLDRNGQSAIVRVAELVRSVSEKNLEVKELLARLEHNSKSNDIGGLVDIIGRLTQEIFDLERDRKLAEILAIQKSAYFDSMTERSSIQDAISVLGSSSQTDISFMLLRQNLKKLVVKWLEILKTNNVSMNIEIDSNMKFLFGGEAFDAITGSTKIRLILGIHAALFELYLAEPKRPFRFFILDTPKQQELHMVDLIPYIAELKRISHRDDGQILFSSTEYRYPTDSDDAEWLPQYDGPDHSMYLGALSS